MKGSIPVPEEVEAMKTNKMLDKLTLDEMVNKAVHNVFITQLVVLMN